MHTIPNTANERLEEFVDLVRQMRAAQDDYFATRRPGSLKDAKRLERKVDLRVELYYSPKLPGLNL